MLFCQCLDRWRDVENLCGPPPEKRWLESGGAGICRQILFWLCQFSKYYFIMHCRVMYVNDHFCPIAKERNWVHLPGNADLKILWRQWWWFVSHNERNCAGRICQQIWIWQHTSSECHALQVMMWANDHLRRGKKLICAKNDQLCHILRRETVRESRICAAKCKQCQAVTA